MDRPDPDDEKYKTVNGPNIFQYHVDCVDRLAKLEEYFDLTDELWIVGELPDVKSKRLDELLEILREERFGDGEPSEAIPLPTTGGTEG